LGFFSNKLLALHWIPRNHTARLLNFTAAYFHRKQPSLTLSRDNAFDNL